MKINILGTEYKLHHVDSKAQPMFDELSCNGFLDYTSKEVWVEKVGDTNLKEPDKMERKTIRHEIIHALLFESGLFSSCQWAQNEEMVDWIAMQFPKMLELFEKAKAMD